MNMDNGLLPNDVASLTSVFGYIEVKLIYTVYQLYTTLYIYKCLYKYAGLQQHLQQHLAP